MLNPFDLNLVLILIDFLYISNLILFYTLSKTSTKLALLIFDFHKYLTISHANLLYF